MLHPFRAVLGGVLLAVVVPAQSATAPAVPAISPAPAANDTVVPAIPENAALLPVNAVVELEMLDTVSSEISKRGDFFRMRVVHPLRLSDRELVPVGTIAVGQVVHAQKAGMGGKGGELILAARYLDTPHGQVPLRSTLGAAGAGRYYQSTTAVLAFGVLGLTVKGKAVMLPMGTALSARIAADTLVYPSPAAAGESSTPTP